MTEWLLRNVLPFVVLVVFVRWWIRPRYGKRGVVEILLVNAVGDLVAHTAFEEQHPLWPGLGAVVLWVAMAALAAALVSRFPGARWLSGYFSEPVVIVMEGIPDLEAMQHTRISLIELESELRKQGLGGLAEAKRVTVEPDGAMAIVPVNTTADEVRRLTALVMELRDQVQRQGASSPLSK